MGTAWVGLERRGPALVNEQLAARDRVCFSDSFYLLSTPALPPVYCLTAGRPAEELAFATVRVSREGRVHI